MTSKQEVPKLRDIQQKFAQTIALQTRTLGQNPLSRWQSCIKPGGTLPNSQAALEVYQGSYRACLKEALADTYEAIYRLIGEAAFATLCREYSAKHPSTFYSLNDYGGYFDAFLEHTHFGVKYPFISDLARFEWAFKDLFHSASALPSNEGAHAGLSLNPSAVCRFIPAAKLFSSPYAVYPFWAQRQAETLPHPLKIKKKAEQLLMYKDPDQRIWIVTLHAWQYDLLASLMAGASIETAFGALSELSAVEVGDFFAKLGSYRIITASLEL